ncbi:MAG: CHRD domain-containing protein [Planctomycetota bacterium]
MRRAIFCIAVAGLVAGAGFGQWQQKATNPSWWPYVDASTAPTVGVVAPAYAGEPLGMVQGYWPRYIASGVWANGKYYVVGGWGPATYTEGSLGWPDNRQSGLDIYDPATNTWSSSKWDGTGPRGLVSNTDLPLGTGPLFGWIQYSAAMDIFGANQGQGSACSGAVEKQFFVWDVKATATPSLRYLWKYDEFAQTLQGLITEVSIYKDLGSNTWVKVKTLWTGAAGQWLASGRTQLNGLWKHDDTEPLSPALLADLAAGNIHVQVHTDACPTGEVAGPLVLNPNFDANRRPTTSYGNYAGTVAAKAYDRNGDGVAEIYQTGGYPHWDGTLSIYDPGDDTWVPTSHGTAGAHYRGTTAIHQGKFFLVGGNIGAKVRIYDIQTDQWIPANEALSFAPDRALGAVVNNKLYIIGGGSDKILSYDLDAALANPLTTDVVDTGDILPYGLNFAAGAALDGKIYIVGGTNISVTPNVLTRVVYVYDPAGAPGSRLTNLNKDFPFDITAASAAIDPAARKLYVGGAMRKAGNLNTSELYVLDLGVPICRGDCNCDARVDFNDINPFVQALSDLPGWQQQYPNCPLGNPDVNADGHIDFNDINPFVALLTAGGGPCD